jgi:hypothetical protein
MNTRAITAGARTGADRREHALPTTRRVLSEAGRARRLARSEERLRGVQGRLLLAGAEIEGEGGVVTIVDCARRIGVSPSVAGLAIKALGPAWPHPILQSATALAMRREIAERKAEAEGTHHVDLASVRPSSRGPEPPPPRKAIPEAKSPSHAETRKMLAEHRKGTGWKWLYRAGEYREGLALE